MKRKGLPALHTASESSLLLLTRTKTPLPSPATIWRPLTNKFLTNSFWSFSSCLVKMPFQATESQSGWGWKASLEVTWSKLPAQAGSPREGHQGLCRDAFEYLQARRLHNLPEQPVPVLSHSHSEKVAWWSEGTACVSVGAHCLCSTTEHH